MTMRNKRTIICLVISLVTIIVLLYTWDYLKFPTKIDNRDLLLSNDSINKNDLAKLIGLLKNIEKTDTDNSENEHVKPKLEELPDIIGLNGVSYCDTLDQTDVLVFITSQAKNFEKRNFIRKTWGHSNVFSRILFFVAMPKEMETTVKLFEESINHGDLLLINTLDSYRGLNIRIISILKWIDSNCDPSFIMKIDDDIIVNPTNFANYGIMDDLKLNVGNKIIYGRVNYNDPTLRSGKYAISVEEWPHHNWPDFVVGFCYLISKPALSAILDAYSRSSWYIWLEDVYITGILRKEGGGHVKQLNLFDYSMDFFKPEAKGGYIRAVDPLVKIIKKFRDESTGLVDLAPLRTELENVCFIHMQTYGGAHQEGTNQLKEWLWNVVWEMNPQMKNIKFSKINLPS